MNKHIVIKCYMLNICCYLTAQVIVIFLDIAESWGSFPTGLFSSIELMTYWSEMGTTAHAHSNFEAGTATCFMNIFSGAAGWMIHDTLARVIFSHMNYVKKYYTAVKILFYSK